MKKPILHFTISIILLLVSVNVSKAQTDKFYTEGPLWQIQFVHTNPGMTELYLKNLSEGWVKEMRIAKQEGLILDFKILSSQPASEKDWDLILMYELKNHAVLDGMKDKMKDIVERVFGGTEETRHTQALSRNDMREMQGGKLTQELQFK